MIPKRVTGVVMSLGPLGGEISSHLTDFMTRQLSEPPVPRYWLRMNRAYYTSLIGQLFWKNFQLPIKNEVYSDPDANGLLDYVSSKVANLDTRFYKQCEAARILVPETDLVVVCEHYDVYLIEK